MITIKNCPSCKSEKISSYLQCIDDTVSRETFTISKCANCSFLFTNNIPKPEELARYYQSEEYISHSNSNKGLFNKLYQIIRSITLRRKVSQLGKETGSLLEFGSGTGELLAACQQKGWECVGIEPEKKGRAQARQNHKLELLETEEDVNFSKNSIDRIMLWHVLEHMPNLQETIGKFKHWLKKDGKLLVAVPNHKSWDAKYYQEHWAAYDVPRHLYHFDKDSIKDLLNQHDLEIAKTKPMWFDAFYVAILSEKIKTGRKKILKGAAVGLISNLNALLKNKEFSSQLFIIEHKNAK